MWVCVHDYYCPWLAGERKVSDVVGTRPDKGKGKVVPMLN
jgi:hypothetical protein